MAEITSVRADKFLWAVRIYKTRSDAADACKSGRVFVNGAEAKPSRDLKVKDKLRVRKGFINFEFIIEALIDRRQPAKTVELYLTNITPQEELDKLNAPRETVFLSRDRGTGRPTKKERRDMDSLLDTFFDLSDEELD
ncbi:Heat shock protein 15 [bioreactor metagenome]|jgi:ribosome-associated heat shock protein Hsp15|uniref:Heat shock protein 15 n=1 Tax=bioreactor metagenome TaxID=1076179 RepID=A0A645B821_9ZZZZ